MKTKTPKPYWSHYLECTSCGSVDLNGVEHEDCCTEPNWINHDEELGCFIDISGFVQGPFTAESDAFDFYGKETK